MERSRPGSTMCCGTEKTMKMFPWQAGPILSDWRPWLEAGPDSRPPNSSSESEVTDEEMGVDFNCFDIYNRDD